MDEWVDVPGLSIAENGILRQSWEILRFLLLNEVDEVVRVSLFDELVGLERAWENLRFSDE